MNTETTMDTIKNQIDKLTATALAIIETTASLTAERDQLQVERDALRTALTAIVTIDDRYSGLDSIARDLMSITARAALGDGK